MHDRAYGGILSLMQEMRTKESKPKESTQAGVGEKARKNLVDQASELPDCTFAQLELRYNTETTVLRRILCFPLHA
jgi:hypothetical protein